MNLYMVHLGFYDEALGGIYESHTNLFVAAQSFEQAREMTKKNDWVRERRMHIDGLQLIEAVDGFRVLLERESGLNSTRITVERHRQLARS